MYIQDKSPVAGRAGAHVSHNAQDSVRGSKESVKGIQGAGDAGGGYAGQMKAIMDAREREMQIQAKAQALYSQKFFSFFPFFARERKMQTQAKASDLYSQKFLSFFPFLRGSGKCRYRPRRRPYIHKHSLY